MKKRNKIVFYVMSVVTIGNLISLALHYKSAQDCRKAEIELLQQRTQWVENMTTQLFIDIRNAQNKEKDGK